MNAIPTCSTGGVVREIKRGSKSRPDPCPSQNFFSCEPIKSLKAPMRTLRDAPQGTVCLKNGIQRSRQAPSRFDFFDDPARAGGVAYSW